MKVGSMKNQIPREMTAVYLKLAVAAYIFGSSFLVDSEAASRGLSTAIAFQRPDNAPAAEASGNVTASQTTKSQTFIVTVKSIPIDQPVDGLALFLGTSPGDSNNFQFINVLAGGGTNGTWRLNMSDKLAPPPLLGLTNITELAGRYVRISDNASNVFLETIIPPFAPSLPSLSYSRRTTLLRPDPAPSPNATGTIRVRWNAVKGTSTFEVRVKNLSAGNSYCCWFLSSPNISTVGEDCPKTPNLGNGSTVFSADTSKGQQLTANGLQDGLISMAQLSGNFVEIRDQFGVTHLQGVIP
jgi:hypothetical protein